MGPLDPAAAHTRDIHVVPRDEIEHGVGGAAGEVDEARAALGTEHGLDLVGIILKPGNDLPAVAAGVWGVSTPFQIYQLAMVRYGRQGSARA